MNGTAASAPTNVVANVADPGAPVVPVAPTGLTVAIAARRGDAELEPSGRRRPDRLHDSASHQRDVHAGREFADGWPPRPGQRRTRSLARGRTTTGSGRTAAPDRRPGRTRRRSRSAVALPLTITSLTANQTFPFRRTARRRSHGRQPPTGGVAPLQYQFWRYSFATAAWTLVQSYSTSATYSWTPTVSDAGRYQLAVQVLNSGSTAAYNAVLGGPAFDITAAAAVPLAITALTPNVTLPASVGTAITWTAITTGGVAPLEYEFSRYSFSTGIWTTVQLYSASNAYTWTPGPGEEGSYQIAVWARTVGSGVPYPAGTGTPLVSITP